jgi:sodium transport system permease protein
LNPTEVLHIFSKEMRELLRDRGIIAVMLCFPAVSLLLLGFIPGIFISQAAQESQAKISRVCLLGPSEALRPFFAASPRIKLLPTPPKESDSVTAVLRGDLDIAVVVANDFNQRLEQHLPPHIVMIDNSMAGYVFDELNVKHALDDFAAVQIQKRLAPYNLPASLTKQITFRSESLENDAQKSAYWVGTASALVLVITMIIFSSTTALDVVTGERERGTLVLLLTSPASRQAIVIGKLLAVTAVSFACALDALCSISLGLLLLFRTTPQLSSTFTMTLPLVNLLLSTVFILPLCLIVAASSLLISAYARTFQQGQAYFLPMLILCMLLGGGALLFEGSAPLFVSFVPVMNLAMCLHKSIQGQWTPLPMILSLASTAFYVALLLRIALGTLDSEESLFGIKQGPSTRTSYAREALVLFGICVGAFFYTMPFLQGVNILGGLVSAQILTIALPALLAPRLCRLPFLPTLRLQLPSVTSVLGGILLVPSLVAISSLLVNLQSVALPGAERYLQALMDFIMPKGTNIVMAYFAIALVPAVCEELLFRGAIQGLLRKSMRPMFLIPTVGLLFGLMHASSVRLLPTTFMGMVFAGVAEVTGSIVPCMIMHACNNALGVYFQGKDPAMTPVLLGCIVLSTLAGIWLLLPARSRRSQELSSSSAD